MAKIALEKIITIRDDAGSLISVVESNMEKRSQIVHITSEVGQEEMVDLLNKVCKS